LSGEDRVTLEDPIQTLLLDQAQGDVEGSPESDSRGERAVRGLLGLALRRLRPVEVVAAPGDLCRQGHRPLVDRRERQAGRRHQRLLGTRDHDVHPPFVLGKVDRAEARDRVHADHRAVIVRHRRQGADVVDNAG
jgi:hypothetical protein